MWKYCIDNKELIEAINGRIKNPLSVKYATDFLSCLGYSKETVKSYDLSDMVFSKGSLDEVYSKNEIELCENTQVFASIPVGQLHFFLINISDEDKYDAYKIGSLIKIINKAIRGYNVVILQNQDSISFGSRYVGTRDYHNFMFTYWMNSIEKILNYSAYNICRRDTKYSYALYMAYISQDSLFKHKFWDELFSWDNPRVELTFSVLSKQLSYITSKSVDSFEILEQAKRASEFILTDKMERYREGMDDIEETDDIESSDLVFDVLREE